MISCNVLNECILDGRMLSSVLGLYVLLYTNGMMDMCWYVGYALGDSRIGGVDGSLTYRLHFSLSII